MALTLALISAHQQGSMNNYLISICLDKLKTWHCIIGPGSDGSHECHLHKTTRYQFRKRDEDELLHAWMQSSSSR